MTPGSRFLPSALVLFALLVGCGVTDDDGSAAQGDRGSTTSVAPSTSADDPTTATEDEATTSTDTEPTADPVEACSLITEEDAAEALGEDVVPGFTQNTEECQWMTADELRTVAVKRLSDDVEEWRAAHRNDSFEEVDVGDEGYYGSVFDDLSFRVGEDLYEVDVELRGEGDAEEVVTDLAELVVSRL